MDSFAWEEVEAKASAAYFRGERALPLLIPSRKDLIDMPSDMSPRRCNPVKLTAPTTTMQGLHSRNVHERAI